MSGNGVSPETAALLAAHALDALDPAEAAEAERLIASSEACRRVFEEALETVAALALATAESEPPAELRERILVAVARLRDGGS